MSPSVQDHSMLPTVQRQCGGRGLETVVRIHNLQPTQYHIIGMVSNICTRLRPTMSEMQDATWRREGRKNNSMRRMQCHPASFSIQRRHAASVACRSEGADLLQMLLERREVDFESGDVFLQREVPSEPSRLPVPRGSTGRGHGRY